MLNIKSFPVILLHWFCLISRMCVRAYMCALMVLCPDPKVVCARVVIRHRKWMGVDVGPVVSPPSPSHSPLHFPQLKHMMVMTGYPDILLKPELIDEEYGVSHELCTVPSCSPTHETPHVVWADFTFQYPALFLSLSISTPIWFSLSRCH